MQPNWTTILNDGFGWGTAEAFGEKLSHHISSPILTISYFDDDVFEMNIYLNGSQQTGQIWCSDLTREDYGLREDGADISILVNILGHQHAAELNEFLAIEGCEEAIGKLEQMIGIPLWIHSDWFGDMEDEDVKLQFKQYNFN
ncbi:hypothetical protein [Paenibacillus sp. MMS18-CY102]|uniref:hypothetical protein n=1 Tax=Paenibacillus sp. MMS18-CY102 TaxID=2682849 RepID=UPI0013657F05|nr:hypothetical protein [Paenibacillus sp. MMS18-CY102]MWC29762.1 hypothetical protein [Paenibacillus sp. MMS18-CY102]